MDIYLSVNNRAEVVKIPVLPPQFTIEKPQGNEVFETVSGKQLLLLGEEQLKGITIESFFPVRDYPFLRDTSMKGWEYVYMIDRWRQQKLPIRLIITDTPINIVVGLVNFPYTIKSDGDLWYKMEFKQFDLLGYE